ncbi:CHC2 zinc finger domain-containing protein [Leptospira kirschneri]|uniref:DNA primase n=1 Tax=Leptospira kirschneri str. 200802841 TaxID=1193047 RepID=A0A828Y7S5_9LEPT|nr:CHC2 zinc finger domain-containing protein [Leptospira kirschneri]EKO53938.1 putative DNA primase [Leptospira kirschneri str. 200802841]
MQNPPRPNLDELKRSVDLVALLRWYGVELKSHGRNFVGRCPFHDDRTPSFVVTPSKNLWHCMGACQSGGSAIDFVMKKERLNLREAILRLRERSTLLEETEQSGSTKLNPTNKTERQPPPQRKEYSRKLYKDFSPEEQNLIERFFTYYQETFTKNKKAKEYLKGRGVYDEEILRKFRVGYADGSAVPELLSPYRTRKGEWERRVLKEYGFLREGSKYESLLNHLVFPLLDEDGNPTGIYGRNLGTKNVLLSQRHRYLSGPHAGLWNREAFLEKDLVLCESVIDALTLYVNGIRNVTCSYGVEGYTQELHSEILKQRPKRIVIAYDNDTGGNEASRRLGSRLIREGFACYRVELPMQTDVNEYAQKVKKPAEILSALVLDAIKIEMGESVRLSFETESDLEEPEILEKLDEEELEEDEGLPETKTERREPLRGFVIERKEDEITFRKGEREYRVRSLFKNQGLETMKVNLRLLVGESYHIETLDLLNQRMRKNFTQIANDATGILEETIGSDLKEVFRELEEVLYEHLEKLKKPEAKAVQMSATEREEALKVLRDPELVKRILEDFERMGLVGERTNSLLGYLATLTRRTENPLAVIIQSSSSAGKSTLMDAILDLVPEEEKEKYSAMTGQSLFYMGAKDLKYKVLAISEEEGVEKAKYALKILQSEKRISIATTTKDQQTGKLATTEYSVEGPVVLFLTTTSVEIDEELQNRAVILTVNEDREQTKTILKNQREEETLEGILRKKTKEGTVTLHQNIQRLLKPLAVVNPYANELKFPDTRLRMRRDQKKYLTLIRSIALLHQHQREVKITRDAMEKEIAYIEVDSADIELASLLFSRVFGKNLDDLSPHTRKLLKELSEYVGEVSLAKELDRSEVRFTRKEIRERTGISDTRLRVHLKRLEDLEYLYARSGKQGLVVEYELLWEEEKENESDFSFSLLGEGPPKQESIWRILFQNADVAKTSLPQSPTSPVKNDTSPPVRPASASPLSGGSLAMETAQKLKGSDSDANSKQNEESESENAVLGGEKR